MSIRCVLAFALTACASSPTPDPVTPAPTPVEPAPTEVLQPTVAHVPEVPILVWRRSPEDSAVGTIGPLTGPPLVDAATAPGSGSLGQGASAPVLSPDGRWVAYLDPRQVPHMTQTATRSTRSAPLPEPCIGAFDVWLSAWSSDGAGIVFYVAPTMCEDCDAPPPECDAAEGFRYWPVDGEARRVDLTAVDAASNRAGCFLSAREHTIVEACVEDTDAQPVRSGSRRVGQISTSGTAIAWMEGDSAGTAMLSGDLAVGENGDEVVVEGAWAEIQWPMATDDARTWMRRVEGETQCVIRVGDAEHEVPLSGHWSRRWGHAGTLLLADGSGLRSVSLADGAVTVLSEDPVHVVEVGTAR